MMYVNISANHFLYISIGYDASSLPPSDIIFIASIPSIVQNENDALSNNTEKNIISVPIILSDKIITLYKFHSTPSVAIAYIRIIIFFRT